MTVKELAEAAGLTVLAGKAGLDREVTGGYACDLISDVMAGAEPGQAWITMQGHVNVAAAAVLKELSAVILVSGRTPSPEMIERAEREGVCVLQSDLPAFELCARIHRVLNG
jgi:predicted transcriptional regulator